MESRLKACLSLSIFLILRVEQRTPDEKEAFVLRETPRKFSSLYFQVDPNIPSIHLIKTRHHAVPSKLIIGTNFVNNFRREEGRADGKKRRASLARHYTAAAITSVFDDRRDKRAKVESQGRRWDICFVTLLQSWFFYGLCELVALCWKGLFKPPENSIS